MLDSNTVIIICCTVIGVFLIILLAFVLYFARMGKTPPEKNFPIGLMHVSPNEQLAGLSTNPHYPPSAPPASQMSLDIAAPWPMPSSLFVRSTGGHWDDAPVIPLGSTDYSAGASFASALSNSKPNDTNPSFMAAPALFSSDPALWDSANYPHLTFPGRRSEAGHPIEPDLNGTLGGQPHFYLSGHSAVSSEYQVANPAPSARCIDFFRPPLRL
jgi:hypothetical protein